MVNPTLRPDRVIKSFIDSKRLILVKVALCQMAHLCTYNSRCVHVSVKSTSVPFVILGMRSVLMITSMHTIAPQQTSTRQSKWHFISKNVEEGH